MKVFGSRCLPRRPAGRDARHPRGRRQSVGFWPAARGIVVAILAAWAFALIWRRDLDLLTDGVRRVATDDTGPVADAERAVADGRPGARDRAAVPPSCRTRGLAGTAPPRRYADPGAAARPGHRAGA